MSRQAVPQSVRDEMDALLDLLMTFAVQAVTEHGEFYPFAGVSTERGGPELLAVGSDAEQPLSSDVLADLELALRARAESGARAVALAADVRVADPGSGETVDAIRVHVEHADGDAVTVFMPYAKKRLRGVSFGELFASPAERLIFI